MPPEPSVLCNVNGKFIVETEEHRIAVPHLHQLWRECSVVGPERKRALVWKVRVEARVYRRCWIDAGIERGWDSRVIDGICLRALHRRFHRNIWRQDIELLVRPNSAGRTPF